MQHYIPSGVCSNQIDFAIENDLVRSVSFIGGCHGNLAGISKLIEGMPAEVVIQKLSGIRCGDKATSCPDQLAQALKSALS